MTRIGFHFVLLLLCIVSFSALAKGGQKESNNPPPKKPLTASTVRNVSELSPEVEAKELDKKALAAYQLGDLDGAISAWTESYQLVRKPELLFNLGAAHWQLGQLLPALDSYDTFLRIADVDHPFRPQAEKNLRSLAKEYLRSARGAAQSSGGALPALKLSPELPAHIEATLKEISRTNRRQGWLYLGAGALVAGGITTAVLLVGQNDGIPNIGTIDQRGQ